MEILKNAFFSLFILKNSLNLTLGIENLFRISGGTEKVFKSFKIQFHGVKLKLKKKYLEVLVIPR